MPLHPIPPALALIGALFLLAPTAGARSNGAISARPPAVAGETDRAAGLQFVHLDEQSLPSKGGLDTAAGTAAAAPSDDSNSSDDWTRIPTGGGTEGSPKGSAVPANVNDSGANRGAASAPGVAVPPATGGAGAVVAAAPPHPPSTQPATASTGNSPIAEAPTLRNASAEIPDGGPPPALDVSAIATGPDLAESSLEHEIVQADTPALAAALRETEQARKELAAGKTNDAIRDLGRAVSIDPGNPFEYFYLGRAYLARKNYNQGLTFLKRAEIGFAARSDWLGETLGFEGACYEELGKMTDAAVAYQRALGSAPNNLMARVGYGRLAANLPNPAGLDAPAPAAQEPGPPPGGNLDAPAPAEAPPPPPPAPGASGSMPGGRQPEVN